MMKKKVFEKTKPKIRMPEKIFLAKKKQPVKYRALKAAVEYDTIKEAEKETGIPLHSIYKAIRWWNGLELDNKNNPIVTGRNKRGRPGKKKEIMKVLASYDENKYSIRQLREKVKKHIGKEYSENYICILLGKMRQEGIPNDKRI